MACRTVRFDAIALGVVLGCLVSGRFAAAGEVQIEASKDNTLYESAAGDLSNGAGSGFVAGLTNMGLIRRGLVAFDVAADGARSGRPLAGGY